MNLLKIEKVGVDRLDEFLEYLKAHLDENGENNLFFLPLNKEQSKYDPVWAEKFKVGISKEFGESGWRRLWVAISPENKIAGHIDIRSRNELNTSHRVLLGMGTDHKFRNQKVGQQLLKFVIDYCKEQPQISWIDLEVMSMNFIAVSIYEKMGFHLLSSTKDMFRFQNQSFDYKSMTLNVE